MSKGKLIVIEGSGDGVGKTTQMNLLKEHLEKDGKSIITHHFPSYKTQEGSLAVNYLQGLYGQPNNLNKYFINSLYAVDRSITWYKDLKSKYDAGQIILLDRYTTSSLIYQSSLIDDINEKKDFINYVSDYEYNKIGIKEPDNVIFLNVPFEFSMNTLKNRSSEVKDIHENNSDYLKRTYDNALFVADYLGWDKIDCFENDQMKSKEDIHNKVYSLIKK